MIRQVDCGRLKAAEFVLVEFELIEKGNKFEVRGDARSGDGVTEEG